MSTYYVRQSAGNNANAGATWQRAFQTLSRGMEALSAGDTLVVGPGTYSPQKVTTAGVILRGCDGAVINGKGTFPFGFLITASHVTVEGFEVCHVKGGAGIHVRHIHHVAVIGNTVHSNEGSGIFVTRSDYITIDRNEVFDNDSDRATSAISVFQPQEFEGQDWWARIRVTNNYIHRNGSPGGSDDFAFILDNNPPVPYLHRVLVEGNLCHDNAKGMLLFNTDNFAVRGNIMYHNGPIEFRFKQSTGRAQDNIAVAWGYGTTYDVQGWATRVAFRGNVAWKEGGDGGLEYHHSPNEAWDFRNPGMSVAKIRNLWNSRR
jgi:parallel beta-helix repeat protein